MLCISRSVSAMDAKLVLITGRRTGSVIRSVVGGRLFVTPEKSAAQIPTLTEIDAMFFVR